VSTSSEPAHIEPIDLRWTAIEAQLIHAGCLKPLSMADTTVAVSYQPAGPGALVYTVRYSMGIVDRDTRPAARLAVTAAVVCTASPAVTESDIEAYGHRPLLRYLHDYLREHLHAITTMMGLPPLVIDVAPELNEPPAQPTLLAAPRTIP
jgi:hypothetical protein